MRLLIGKNRRQKSGRIQNTRLCFSVLRNKQSIIMSKKVALITGVTGQDGSYLAELLLEKGYEVH